MKTKKPVLTQLALVSSAVLCCALKLHAQSAPTITNQPASQTNLAGANVTFSVGVAGDGPFSYQWQLNGANLPKIITTIAGNGHYGFSGDGGPATNAELTGPNSALLDASGSILITDCINYRVRKVATNGIITTVAGNGTTNATVSGEVATNTGICLPAWAVADSAGNIFISEQEVASGEITSLDKSANCIARVGTNGLITNLIPLSNGQMPEGIAVDASENLLISLFFPSMVVKAGTNGTLTVFAGKDGGVGFSGDGGPATNATLSLPCGIFLDSAGNLFIADSGNQRIREVGATGIITTIAGNGNGGSVGDFSGDGGPATNASFKTPRGVALDAFGNLLIADANNNRIRQVDRNGIISTIAGGGTNDPGDGGAATNAVLHYPSCVAVDANGNIIIDDNFHCLIREVVNPGPSLLLNDVDATNAGDYSVVITSPYGSVTSAVATLTVTVPRTPPQIISSGDFGFLSNQFGFNVSGAFGQAIVVKGSTDLVDWIPLFTNTVLGNAFHFSDPAGTNFPRRFYRATLP